MSDTPTPTRLDKVWFPSSKRGIDHLVQDGSARTLCGQDSIRGFPSAGGWPICVACDRRSEGDGDECTPTLRVIGGDMHLALMRNGQPVTYMAATDVPDGSWRSVTLTCPSGCVDGPVGVSCGTCGGERVMHMWLPEDTRILRALLETVGVDGWGIADIMALLEGDG